MAAGRLRSFRGIHIVQNERGVTLVIPIELESRLQEIERQLRDGIAEISGQRENLPAIQVGPVFIDRIFRECFLDIQPAGIKKSVALEWVTEIMQLRYGYSDLSPDEIKQRLIIIDDTDKDLISVGFNVGSDPSLGGHFIGYFDQGSLLILMLARFRMEHSDGRAARIGNAGNRP